MIVPDRTLVAPITDTVVSNNLHVENVLPFALDCLDAGRHVCIVTLVAVEGAAPRAVGAQMAIAQDGRSVGNFTGGCLEGAVVAEALRVMDDGTPDTVRFGKGSRYFDIVLPCGSGLDLHFEPNLTRDKIRTVLETQTDRKPALMRFDMSQRTDRQHPVTMARTGQFFERWYLPNTRLLIAGDSPATSILAQLARQADLEVHEWRPGKTDHSHDLLDRWSAVALLFHDHEKEDKLLAQALQSDCFFVGALGSHRTHKIRLLRLKACGFTPQELGRIRSPIGLIPGAKNPVELAVSVLAEVVDEARRLRHVDRS